MDVSSPVRSMGWTRRNAASSLLLVLDVQRREVGRRVVQLRESKGWGQEDLAHHADVSVKTVSRVENGRHEARNNTVERIADALGVDKDDLWPRPAPLGLGAEDPYADQLDRIEKAVLSLQTDLAEIGVELERRKAPAPKQQRPRRAAGS